MTLLDRYLLLALLRGGTPVFLLFMGLFGFISLAQQLEDVGKGAFGTLEAVRVTGFSLPRIALDVLPVTCLLGTVLGLGALGTGSELTAMRASGIGMARLARPLLLLSLAIMGVAFVTQQFVIPAFESRASHLRTQSLANTTREGSAYWTRSQSSLMRVGGVQYGAMPADIEIYRLDEVGRVVELIQADGADLVAPGEWWLNGVRITRFETETVERSTVPRLRWPGEIDPAQFVTLARAEHALAPTELVGYIDHLDRNRLDAHRFRILLWQQISLPIGVLAMVLLGLPFATNASRTAPMGTQVTFCALIGLAFYLVEQASMQVGLLYRLPAALTGLGPDLGALAAALAIIWWRR